MALRWKVPAGLHQDARACVVGILDRKPIVNAIVGERKRVARGFLQVGLDDIAFVAYGDVATAMASMDGGQIVEVEGLLRPVKWKTGSSGTRERTEIEIGSIEAKGRATEQWTPPR